MCFMEQKLFSVILRIFRTNVPPLWFRILVYKNADVDNFYSKSLRSMAMFLYRFKVYYNVFCGTENIFCDITYFPHKCATFVVPFVFWYTKMLTLTIFTQNRRGVWLKFLYRFKGYYNVFCGTENIFCDITYFPHKCATFLVSFVFWFTKMLTLTVFTQNCWGVWLKCLCRFKGYYNVFCGTENIFCDITYFPHKCATFMVPFVFWFTKMLTLTIFTQNRRGVWLKCLCRFKGYYNVFCGTENIFCDITYFPHKCATFFSSLCILVYKNADVDNFYSKSLRSMAKMFIQV